MSDPRAEYEARLARRREEATRRTRLDRRISNLRLAVFAALVVGAFAAFGADALAPAWLLLPAVLFVALLLLHDRVIRERERAERAVAFYERGLARLDHAFAGTGETGAAFRDPEHAYAEDLDLFGEGGLFELVCGARTRAGQATLARWLLEPSDPETVRARQAAVAELRERIDLREDLALLGAQVRAELHTERLRAWGEAPRVPFASSHRVVAPVLVAIVLAALGLWIFTAAGPIPFVLALAMEGGYALVLRPRVLPILQAVDAPVRELDLFARLLARIEAESFVSPRLVVLRQTLDTEGLAPSRRIARLHRLLELLDARRNQLFAPLAALLLWATQLGLAVERWRARCGPALGRWIEAAGEFEALCSLAGLAFERPTWRFPELHVGTPRFEADGLGHPLIPPHACVENDVSLGDGAPQVLVVSGSNMSGKSTLLRSIGVAAVLAQAGAPVYARRLALSPLRVGASIRVQDSLQKGTSHFYAEITRVRRVMELAESGPTLFLLDEIFHGTNSHDRGIGAEAVVQGLMERGAIGLVTTHDLALAGVAERLAPRAGNVHFQDHVEEGRMVFDYRMRDGVVTRSNAIALMRAVGLPV